MFVEPLGTGGLKRQNFDTGGSAVVHKAGCSITFTVPSASVAALGLTDDMRVNFSVREKELVLHSGPRGRYTLEELLARCEPGGEVSEEDRQWIGAPSVGREL